MYEGFDFGASNYAAFTVSLSHDVSTQVSVNWSTTSTDATPGSDYIAASGTITFQPGYVESSILIDLVDDTNVESPEDFWISLNNPTSGTLGDSMGRVTILDNDSSTGSGSGAGSGSGGGSGSGSGAGSGSPAFKSRRLAGGEFPAEQLFTIKVNEHYESGSPFEFNLVNPPAYAAPRIQIESTGGAEIADHEGAELTHEFSVGISVTRLVRYYDDADDNGDFTAGETSIVSATFVVQPVKVHEIRVRRVNGAFAPSPAEIRSLFKEATNRAIRKDDEADFRSAMKFKVLEVKGFEPRQDRPRVADTPFKAHPTNAYRQVCMLRILSVKKSRSR